VTEHVHVSDLRFDRLLADELAADAAAAVRAEAAGCAQCSERLAELTRGRDAFAQRPAFGVAQPPARRWWLAMPAVLAAAAALVLVLRARDPGESERPKGGGIELYLAAGPKDHMSSMYLDGKVHPGDYLQAGYTASQVGFGAVLSRDGADHVSAYVPADRDVMVALPAGRYLSFPASTLLDDVLGEEHAIVIWCPSPRPLAPLLRELGARGDITPPEGCKHRTVVIYKDAR
jgi:hypothetical protein